MTEAERRATEAKAILESSVLSEAFVAVEKDAYEDLLKVVSWHVDAERQRTTLINRINAIRDLRAHLQMVVTQGTQSARKPQAVA